MKDDISNKNVDSNAVSNALSPNNLRFSTRSHAKNSPILDQFHDANFLHSLSEYLDDRSANRFYLQNRYIYSKYSAYT